MSLSKTQCNDAVEARTHGSSVSTTEPLLSRQTQSLNPEINQLYDIKKLQLSCYRTIFRNNVFIFNVSKCVSNKSCRGNYPPTSPKGLVLVTQTDFCVFR